MPAVAEMLLLPQEMRLPDLSQVRAAGERTMRGWHEQAVAAFEWGPDERNGCTRAARNGVLAWRDERGRGHSPDPHTPAVALTKSVEWRRHGLFHCYGNQPALIGHGRGVATWHQGKSEHRTHGPATLYATGHTRWVWQGRSAQNWPMLTDLLHAAWADPDLTDERALALLDTATRTLGGPLVPVSAQQWLAHVLAAHPSQRLTAATRAWCRLIIA